MLEFRRSLPAYKEKESLLRAISENQVLVFFLSYLYCFLKTTFYELLSFSFSTSSDDSPLGLFCTVACCSGNCIGINAPYLV